MRKVDFFIVGQPKSGTTALAHFLSSHPLIGISNPKETAFFATDLREESDSHSPDNTYFRIRTLRQYEQAFKNCEHKAHLGDASTNYLYSRVAAENIYKYNSFAKIIIMLREPVSFMHSLHMQYLNTGLETEKSFERALSLEPERKMGNGLPRNTITPSYYFYSERASYLEQIRRYFDRFPRENIYVIITEDFQKNNRVIFEEVVDFLGIRDNQFYPDFHTVHGSKKPRFELLNLIMNDYRLKKYLLLLFGQRLYTRIGRAARKALLKSEARTPIDAALKVELHQQYRQEMIEVGKCINKDLTRQWNLR